MGESGRAGQEKGSLISTFPCFLAAIVGVRFLEGGRAGCWVST